MTTRGRNSGDPPASAEQKVPSRGPRSVKAGRRGQGAVMTSTQRRIEGTFYVTLLPLLFLAGRLVQLQGMPSSQAAISPQTFVRKQQLPARRAQILASDGTALAITLDEYDVCANPRAVKDKEEMARRIAKAIGGDSDEYLQILQKTQRPDGKPNYYVKLARHVDEGRMEKLRKLQQPTKKMTREERRAQRDFWAAITEEPSPRRHYPLGNVASQLIGFTTSTGQGGDGLEKAWQKELAGQDGERVSQVDARERPVPGFVESDRPPVPGHTIVTTIDPQIQADTDAVLNKLVGKFHPNFATAIVMRPRTGEILAMTTAPTFDLNRRPKNVVELATNRCLNFGYEPGSTFKIITASAAVENVDGWQGKTFYCNGVERVGKHNMHCWVNSTSERLHGVETLSDSIRDSCNFGVYGFARLMGADTLFQYARNFGLAEPVNLDGMSEHPGLLPANSPSSWSAEQLANFSFGQGMLMTPLQLARVASTIANDGVMMQPYLVKELRDEQGRVVKQYQPREMRRVIRPETAHAVTEMMGRVTAEGTARKYIFVPGYATAGKTGSAQKADGPRGYAAGKFISSFVGFVPAQKPEFVILVMADEPKGSHWGSEVCGPAFNDIANKAMLRLRLEEGASAPAPVASLMHRAKEPVKTD